MRYIRIYGDGLKTITFDVETKDIDLEVADFFQLSTSQIQNTNGNPIVDRKYFVISKQQVSINSWRYKAYDAQLTGKRIGYIAPAGHPDYTAATEAERDYAFIGNSSGVMSNGDTGYFIF